MFQRCALKHNVVFAGGSRAFCQHTFGLNVRPVERILQGRSILRLKYRVHFSRAKTHQATQLTCCFYRPFQPDLADVTKIAVLKNVLSLSTARADLLALPVGSRHFTREEWIREMW